MSDNNKRKQDLNRWLKTCFNEADFSLTPLKQDASFRRYWRITTDDQTYVLMDAPPDKEPLAPFIKTTKLLSNVGIHVPKLFHQNQSVGGLVLADFGDTLYADALTEESARELYQKAIDALITIQSISALNDLPTFDEPHIRMELGIFDEWFLQRHMNIKSTSHFANYDYLINTIQIQPQVAIHRDYHSRNLMLTPDHAPGVLDHQDMMQGPISYDLVSLLRDCYIEWGPSLVNALIEYYLSKTGHPFETFKTWFDITGIQRHLKAIGIFARLNYLYDNPHYLKHIKLPLKYIQAVADKNSELNEIGKLVNRLT